MIAVLTAMSDEPNSVAAEFEKHCATRRDLEAHLVSTLSASAQATPRVARAFTKKVSTFSS